MIRKLAVGALSLTLAGAALLAWSRPHSRLTAGMTRGTPEILSLGKLAFGPEGILLIGDSRRAAVFAVDLGDNARHREDQPLEVKDIEGQIAAMLGTTRDEILIHDMAVNPVSQSTYLSVSRGRQQTHPRFVVANDAADARVLVRVTPAGGLEEVPLTDVRFSSIEIPKAPDEASKLWMFKARSFTVTDLAFDDGKVYVAGLSNEEFASTFRVIPFPFSRKVSTSTLRIYHAAHGEYETEAPIETFLPIRINGESILLAAYTCTPLATFPMTALRDGAHVNGKTIGELGAGNMPLDMVAYSRDGNSYILLANSARALMRIDVQDISKQKTGLTTPVRGYRTAGVPFAAAPVVGVQQLDRLNDGHMLMLVRSLRDGTLDLTSLPTDRI